MYLHSMPVKMAAEASKAIWKLSLLTAEMWQETSLDVQKARRRQKAALLVLLARKSRILNEETWNSRTMESWRHRFFQNLHTPELVKLLSWLKPYPISPQNMLFHLKRLLFRPEMQSARDTRILVVESTGRCPFQTYCNLFLFCLPSPFIFT